MASSLVASAIQWIGSSLIQEASILFEVSDQVRGLQDELKLMQPYLQDADAKQETMEISTLIVQMRKLAYDVEDVIDTYILEVEAKAPGNKGWFMNFARFLHTRPQAYRIRKQIQSMHNNVKRITDKLIDHGISKMTTVGNDLISSSDRGRYTRQQPRSYPYDDDGEFIVGLEKDIKRLIEVLVGEGNTQISVVSIVGMGGSGKTTLARKLYNHTYATECFDCRAWVYVSQEWSTRHVLSEILRKVSSPIADQMSGLNSKSSVEELVDKLRSILEKKSYLVVLDDVWRKEALEEILPALPRVNNNKGSKIIITTRKQEVVQFQNLQRHLYVHEPRLLNTGESWELFCKIAFNYHTNCNDESYEVLGKEMLKKCDGLPLAIVALAGILNTKNSIREWQQVSEVVRSRVMEGTCTHMYGRVGEMLSLSFNDLPCDLKPCFLYLGVFPEDCRIPAGMLTRMWIAEGFVVATEEMSLEDVAMQYLVELSQRFMIRVARINLKGAIKEIHLHDLLRELCVKKSREQSFLQINPPVQNNPAANDASQIAIQSRRAALHSSICFPTQVSKLRSLLLLTKSTTMPSAYDSKMTVDLEIVHRNFKLLRMLNLWGIKTSTGVLPKQIGSLVHLRYLGIRASNITELPQSIGNLRNLLTFDYRNIDSNDNVKVPNALCKLMQLRHLFLPIECPWTPEELQLSALKNLQILWGVKSSGGEWLSRELQKVSTSLKKLKVVVSTEKDLEAAFSCPSLISDQLHTFHCEWGVGIALSVNRVVSHNQHLHKLVLVGKIQVEKLSFILPSNLLILELKDSALEEEDSMVVIGALAHLKLLRLSNAYIGEILTCDLGSFPRLEELYLNNLKSLRAWKVEKGALPNLKKLEILSCTNLQDFPQNLTFVTTLQHVDFYGVSDTFGEQARACGWSQSKRKLLPHNFESIIKNCDIPLDISSIQKLYKQLASGVFLNKRRKKFWVIKQGGRQYNCFMVYVIDLIFHSTNDRGDALIIDGQYDEISEWMWDWKLIEHHGDHPHEKIDWTLTNWKLIEIEESEDSPLTKIGVMKPKSGVFGFRVRGTFDTRSLSLDAIYTFSLVIMFDGRAEDMVKYKYGCRITTEIKFPGRRSIRERALIEYQSRNEWVKVLIGEFETRHTLIGKIEFSLRYFSSEYSDIGITIKGVIIEPKL